MSKRIPATLKKELGERLAKWYRMFGKVAPRRAYYEDDSGSGDASMSPPLFEGHPLLAETPIGAPSDLSSILTADERTLEEADKRSEELTNDLQNKLSMELGKKYKKDLSFQITPRPN